MPEKNATKDKGKKQTILLVEDDQFISRAYRDGLSKAGFEIIPAFNGNEAEKKLKTLRPSIILLDIIMPDKDGFEFLTEIKADPKIKDIPVLMLSNLSHEKIFAKATKLGACGYLVKSDQGIEGVVSEIRKYI